ARELLGRAGDLLGLEQFALGRAAERDHAPARRQDRAVGQSQERRGWLAWSAQERMGGPERPLHQKKKVHRRERLVAMSGEADPPASPFTRAEIEAGRKLFAGDWTFAAAAG